MKNYMLALFIIMGSAKPFHGWSQSLDDSSVHKLDKIIEDFKNKYKSPGISFSIIHGNEIIYSRSLGFTDQENKVSVTIDSKFPIMSVTKTFTATMLMQLKERGIVKLDDDVKKYVPEYKVKSDFSGASATTLFQLATHSSGLPRNSPVDIDFTVSLDRWMLTDGKDSIRWFPKKQELLKSLQFLKLEYPPFHYIHHNDRHYSNLGYSVLGIALERAAKLEFSKYVINNICKPLELMNTGFLNHPEINAQIAKGYRYNVATGTHDRVPYFEPHSAIYPGGMYSTARDLSKYISFQFENDHSVHFTVLSSEGRAMMRYLKIGWKPAYPFVMHEGSIPGYRSIVVFNPELQLGWVILTNATDIDFNQINGLIADIVTVKYKKKSISDLTKYTGTYKLPGGFGSLRILLKNDSLYSSYLQDLLPDKPLIRDGDFRYKVEGTGYNINYEFVAEGSEIKALKLGQFLWHKE